MVFVRIFSIYVALWGLLPAGANAQSGDFISVPETVYYLQKGAKTDSVRLEAFEICDHPVTNKEYAQFISATGHKKPAHWLNGQIPAGKEEYPVIFVNRFDVEAYLQWRNKTDPQHYRLPLTAEQELLTWARRGKNGKWTVNRSATEQNVAGVNYDKDLNRPFDKWAEYLQSARSGAKNEWGLYTMLGNVWQLNNDYPDPAINKFKFKIVEGPSLERSIMGGSWARSQLYLQPGVIISQSPGIWHPDIGFRLVRQPQLQPVKRRLNVVPAPDNKLALSWGFLATDGEVAGFNIYRFAGDNRNQAGFKINKQVIKTTSYLDQFTFKPGQRYQYRVCGVNAKGQIINTSEWVGITFTPKALPVIVSFTPVQGGGSLTPVFGDLEGHGRVGCVMRLGNGNTEASQDPGLPVQLEAFSAAGQSLWRRDIARHDKVFGNGSNAAFNVWDMDQDGKAEVITLYQEGDSVLVVILDGMSGQIVRRAPWPRMVTDLHRSSTRMQLSVAYLDGKNPAVITQTGLYENEVIAAFDQNLKPLWRYNSFGATSGSGSHKIEVADVNGDGKQEVVYGSTCLNGDGTMRWSIYKQHPDIVSIHDFIPSRKGLEVFFGVETTAHAGAYMVDADTGEILWKNNREDDPAWNHAHIGWTADIWDGAPGMECITNRAGHADKDFVLFSADGKKLKFPFPSKYRPFEIDGDQTRELISNNGYDVSNFDGKDFVLVPNLHLNPVPQSSVYITADLYGDFRDEVVITRKNEKGQSYVSIVAVPTATEHYYVSPRESLDYRLWQGRNKGGGYGSIFDPQYQKIPLAK